jgi:antitoxin YefM
MQYKETDMETMSINEAGKDLDALPGKLEAGHGEPVALTRGGKPVLAVLSWEHYQSMLETMEVLADKELCAAIRRSIDDDREGRVVTSEDVAAKLGL